MNRYKRFYAGAAGFICGSTIIGLVEVVLGLRVQAAVSFGYTFAVSGILGMAAVYYFLDPSRKTK